MTWAEEAHAACRRAGRRNGAARRAVIAVLDDAQGGLTAHEVATRAATGRGPVSNASTYRILGDLAAIGVVRPVEIGTGQTTYELLRSDGHHEHHLVCDDCGRTNRFSDPALEQAIHAAEGRLGFDVHAHDLVLHGRCEECRVP